MEDKFDIEVLGDLNNAQILQVPGDHAHATIETEALGTIEIDRRITGTGRDVTKIETETQKISATRYPTTGTTVKTTTEKNNK